MHKGADVKKHRCGVAACVGACLAVAVCSVVAAVLVWSLWDQGELEAFGASADSVSAEVVWDHGSEEGTVVDGARFTVVARAGGERFVARHDADAPAGDALLLFPVSGDVVGIVLCQPRLIFAVVNTDVGCDVVRYQMGAHAAESTVAHLGGAAKKIACKKDRLCITDAQGKIYTYRMAG